MSATIFVRFEVVGAHRWPGAEGVRSYLAARHRHKFHFLVECPVLHDDREIEFHDLQAAAAALVRARYPSQASASLVDFGSSSCEAIARTLGTDLLAKYPGRVFIVTVSEDDECGAKVIVS